MIDPKTEAQAQALDSQARALWDRSNELNRAEYVAAGLHNARIPPGYACPEALVLRKESTALRAQAKALREGAVPYLRPASPIAPPAVDKVLMPFPVLKPSSAVDAALAANRATADAHARAVEVEAARKAKCDADIDALVSRIIAA